VIDAADTLDLAAEAVAGMVVVMRVIVIAGIAVTVFPVGVVRIKPVRVLGHLTSIGLGRVSAGERTSTRVYRR
jgi:hypothetical protein